MTDEELDALLEGFAGELVPVVQAQLDLVADQFATDVNDATELVAAAYSVSNIRELWNRRVPQIMTRLRGVFRRSARLAAQELDAPGPTPAQLDRSLEPYAAAVRPLLRTVGDNLAAAAQQTLAEGVNNGDSIDQLKARMKAAFANTGAQLGPVRADRIAQTEAVRAFNAGTLAAAEIVTGPDRPLVKQWVSRRDNDVRSAHRDADGQVQLLADPFKVGGFDMHYPGDPSAPADLTINCRCVLKVAAPTGRTASMTEGAEQTAAARTEYDGAMVALMPDAASAARLAAVSDEAEDQLHLTLFYLGEAADWDEAARAAVIQQIQRAAGWIEPVRANAFGVAQWNPAGDNPAFVWNVGDDLGAGRQRLRDVHQEMAMALGDGYPDAPMMPEQHSPWAPHVCAAYGEADMAKLAEGCGPVTFDRLRVGFGGEYTDFPLTDNPEPEPVDIEDAMVPMPVLATWSTPDNTALAFENQQTGDGRVFSPGALYWDGNGPWPLMANEHFDSHDDASLVGAIGSMYRDGDRIGGDGLIYLNQEAGGEAAMLLAQGAPLGVSVDLDDVDIEMVDATNGNGSYRAKLLRASVLPTPDGGFFLRGVTGPEMHASATATVTASEFITLTVGPDGRVPRSAFELSAAAGDSDAVSGDVVDSQRSGDYLMRITRGRVRGATLVTVPAFAGAKITLDDPAMFASAENLTAAVKSESDYDRVLRHVRRSKSPVGPARVAQYLKIPITAARRLLAQAASRGEVVRLTWGLYTDSTTSAKADHVMIDDRTASAELVASVTGSVDLPVAGRDVAWDGDAATGRVFAWADGDTDKIARAYAYRDDNADPATQAAYKLGYADVVDGVLTIVPRGVFAAEAAVNGARGGVDIPQDQLADVKAHLAEVRAHVDEVTGGESMDDMQASAWETLSRMPAMPAAWFREPTMEELPPGGPGVNYADGRIFGWVAQANEPHAGYAKRIVINDLGRIDTSHFLRNRRELDDGSTVKVGAFTMNAGHHRDGAECETSACQFDDTRTVAGVVTVGMNERGMWFSGAAAPWLSEWDRTVFSACQPSYHLKQGQNGQWQLRAVLSVPVPGHSSPLLASAVVERSQLALTAAATMSEVDRAVRDFEAPPEVISPVVPAIDYDQLADSLVAAMSRAEERKSAEQAELAALLKEATTMVVDTIDDGK